MKKKGKQLLSLLLSTAMVLSLLPSITLPARAAAPIVSSVTPSGTDADISGSIVITFSEAVNTDTLGTVSLDGGSTSLSGGSLSGDATVYTVPYSALNYATTYTVTISGFEDSSGNIMTAADSSHSFTTLSGGSGTAADPYIINTLTELKNVTSNPSAYFKLGADISGLTAPLFSSASPFTGHFDGNGKTITLSISDTSDTYVGLFAYLGSGATVTDLTVAGSVAAVLPGSSLTLYLGALAGDNAGTVTNCVSSATVSARNSNMNHIGGLIGYNTGSISGSFASGGVTANSKANVGGLVGTNYNIDSKDGTLTSAATIDSSHASGAVLAKVANSNVGGLVGSNTTTTGYTMQSSAWVIKNSYATGNVTETPGSEYIGGLIGYNQTVSVKNCYSQGNITATCNTCAGGLIGFNTTFGTFDGCHTSGDVIGSNLSSSTNLGGLIGKMNSGTINGCYTTGDVLPSGISGGSCYCAGLVGYMKAGSISLCYTSGKVTLTTVTGTSHQYGGGLVGWMRGGTVTNCYSTGSISGTSLSSVTYLGGLIACQGSGTITGAYSACAVSGTGAKLGGIFGEYGVVTMTGCYWNSINNSASAGNTATNYGTGLTTNQMTGDNAATNMSGLDFAKPVWVAKTNGASAYYPQLKNFADSSDDTVKADSLAGVTVAAVSDFTSGSGISGDPYIIATLDQLKAAVNYPSAYYKLGADITGVTAPLFSSANPFTGDFDGNGKTITLNISDTSDTCVGLFGSIGTGAVINNLNLAGSVSATLSGTSSTLNIGALAGSNAGTVSGCVSSVDVTTTNSFMNHVGGLIGYNTGTISGSSASGKVTANGTANIGGLTGTNYSVNTSSDGGSLTSTALISGCAATGAVTTNTINSKVGGLVGANTTTYTNTLATENDTVADSNASGAVSDAPGSGYAGGLIGYNQVVSVKNCYSTGTVVGTLNICIGGFIGFTTGGATISDCHAKGNVVDGSISQAANIGGLVGKQNSGAIQNSYATGKVITSNIGAQCNIGGLVGFLVFGSINYCFASGDVTASNCNVGSYIGGFIGYTYGYDSAAVNDSNASVNNSYASGSVTETPLNDDSELGGFVGHNSWGYYTDDYALGAVTGGGKFLGGFGGSGTAYAGSTIASTVYWNSTLNGRGNGFWNTFTPGTGLTSDNMSGTDASKYMTNLDFSSASPVWTTKAYDGSYNYAPQLNVFAKSSDSTVAADSLTSVELATKSTVKLDVPVNPSLTWEGTMGAWNTVNNAKGYDLALYKDGSLVKEVSIGPDYPYDRYYKYDFSSWMTANGAYTFTVKAKGGLGDYDGITYTDGEVSAFSAVYNYVVPLSTPVNLKWDTKTAAKATWDAVSGAVSYTIQLYKDGVASGDAVTNIANNYYDFTSAINDTGSYTYKVAAIADGTTYSNSATSAASAGYSFAANSTIGTSSASFDKYSGSAGYVDIPVTLTLRGNTLSGVYNGETALNKDTDYTVSDDGNTVTLNKACLAALEIGDTTLTFKFSAGSDATLTVTVSETATYGISLSQTDPYTFTGQTVGYSSVSPLTVTVSNTGNKATGDLTVALSNAGKDSFTLSKAAVSSIAAGGTDTFTIVPNDSLSAGTYTATVTVTGGNSITKSFDVSFTVSDQQTYGISLSQTDPYTFTGQTVGYSSVSPLSVTVTNIENQATGDLTVALSGAGKDSFTLSKATVSSIAAGGTDTFTIVPNDSLSAGTYTATVTVTGGNSITKSFDVSFTVTDQQTYGISLSQTDPYTFTGQTVGYSSVSPLSVTVTNTGNQATGDLTVALSGAGKDSFTLSKAAVSSIAAGSTDTFSVVPNDSLSAGTYTATVTVTGGNSITKSFDVSFTVSETATYGISLSQTDPYTFTGQTVGYSSVSPLSVTVSNTGDQATGDLTVALTGTGKDSFTLSKATVSSIATGGTDTFTVVPNDSLSAGTYTATVTVTGGNSITKSFDVSFTVNDQQTYGISLSQTDPYTFTGQTVGYSSVSPLTVTVSNTENQATGDLTVALSGTGKDSFTLSKATVSSIAAGGTDTFTVVPNDSLSAGTYTATVTVTGGNSITKSFDVSFTVNDQQTYGISLSQTDPYTFTSQTVGYSSVSPLTVTVSNTGDQATGDLTVALSGTGKDSFTLSKTTISSIAAGGTDTFSVVPNDSLTAGTYTATVTVSGDNVSSQSFTVSFTVSSASSGGSTGGSSSSGGGSTTSNNNITVTTENNTTTTSQTFTASTGSNGVAAASVTSSQISEMIAAAEEKAASNAQTAVAIQIETGNGATGVSVNIPQAAVTSLKDSTSTLTVSSSVATVELSSATLAEISKQTSGDITITATAADTSALSADEKAAIGTRPVYDLKITSGSTTVSSFGGGTATVSVPYTPAAGENVNAIVVYYINASGGLVTVPNCVYDAKTGTVAFTTTHFSTYVVGYNAVSFSDVSDSAWYADYVTYLAARGIVGGNNGAFSPNATITRAEFVTILARTSGDDLNDYTTSAFSDVSTNSWYFAAVQWANKTGIASGYNGKFSPNASITREQMAAMLYRYAEYKGTVSNTEGMSVREFTDYDSILNWAQAPIQWAMNNGILSGNTDGSFAPKSSATRAQAAKMLAVLMQRM